MISVGVVGASGYTGGEVLRILLRHPEVQIAQATSESNAGHYLYAVHPNLRKQTPLKFTTIGDLKPCDVLFLCLPHGSAMRRIVQLESMAKTIIDLSADFRLRCPDDYPTWYGHPHDAPQYLERFVYGIPELHRKAIGSARFITVWHLYGTAVVATDVGADAEALHGAGLIVDLDSLEQQLPLALRKHGVVRGSLKAVMPLEIASTPVSAVVPFAKA